MTKNVAPSKQPEPVKPPKERKCVVILDMEKVRHSQVLKMKKIFSEHRGDMPVELNFMIGTRELATLHIDVSSGILFNLKLKEELLQLAAIKDVQGD